MRKGVRFLNLFGEETRGEMRRVSIILALATVLALTLSATAWAALAEDPSATLGDGVSDYQSPTTPYIPSDNIINGGTQKIHSAYEKNTDACASCHSTHTAVGEALLQWADVNTTCFACHDGTVAKTYNVVDGKIGDTDHFTYGGLFAGTGAESASTHGVADALATSAAPGGSGDEALSDTHGVWNTEFTCVACHTPHGQGNNARILTPDPNGIALQNKVAGETLTNQGDDKTYKASQADWIMGYPYSKSTKITSSLGTADTYTIDYRNGMVTFANADATRTVTANYVPGVRVTMDIQNVLTATETVTYTGGLNAFCGACHTDYDTSAVTSPHANLNGTYTEAYRHKVGFSRSSDTPGLKFEMVSGVRTVTCLTCHVAHGTDQDYWVASLAGVDGSYWTPTTAHELDGSSALKRKPNMAVCESCHSKGPASSY